jgi:predicted ArsR family transcriptional regulator
VTRDDSLSGQSRPAGERWQELLDWLDHWFQPEKAQTHDFDFGERELFDQLGPAWLEADMGRAKIDALEAASERFGRDRVMALIAKLCASETTSYWAEVARREGGSLDDLVRLLWEPLRPLGFEFSSERTPDGIQFRCTHCPHAELARELGANDWLAALVCAGDPHIAASFDPPIGFERTKTLMHGDDHCDHRYFI